MAYTTLAQVEGAIRGPALTDSSVPTVGEAQDIIDAIADEIDGALASNRVTVPVSSPAAFVAFLGTVNLVGAVAHIGKLRPQLKRLAEEKQAHFDRLMDRLWDGSAIPPGVAAESDMLPTSWAVEYPDEDVDLGDIAEPTFADDWEA